MGLPVSIIECVCRKVRVFAMKGIKGVSLSQRFGCKLTVPGRSLHAAAAAGQKGNR